VTALTTVEGTERPPTVVTFIIPIRANRNIRDHGLFRVLLQETAGSIWRQTSGAWRCVVVADGDTLLPDLPPGFEVLRVGFPANDLHDRETSADIAARAAFRHDKGQRVLAGILAAPASPFVMIVDDDDLVDRRLVEFVADRSDAEGWFVDRGFEFWQSGGDVWSIPIEGFWNWCGTCNVFRPERLPLPDRADYAPNDMVSELLGGHVRLKPFLERQGQPLQPLPFRAAAYRRGHANSHSSMALARTHMLRRHVFNRALLTQPVRNVRNALRLARNSGAFREQFLGEPSVASPFGP
jgi:hypothetical protein